MKKADFTDIIVYPLLAGVGFFIRLMPMRAVLFLGRLIGRLIFFFYKKRKLIAYGNLKSVFSGEKSPGELNRITRRVFEHFACMLLEIFKFPQIDEKYARENIDDNGFENLGDAIRRGKGAIILTGHFGNWELSSLIGAIKGFKQDVLAREQKHPRLNGLLNSYREIYGRRVITKGISTRHLINALKENRTIAFLTDQDAGANGFLVEFFNRLTSTAPGAIVFGLKFDAPVLPNFCVRVNGPRYKLTIQKPMELVQPSDKKEGSFDAAIQQNLQKFTDILQGYIKENPGQWLWAHKRWKTSPSRRALILTDGKAGHLNQAYSVSKQIRRIVFERADKDARVQFFKKIRAKNAGQGFSLAGLKACPASDKDAHAAGSLLYSQNEARVEFKSRIHKLALGICSLFASSRCQGCVKCLKLCLTNDSYRDIISANGQIIVSCSSSASIATRFIAKENNAKSVVVMKPPFLPSRMYDLCFIPRHDNLKAGKGNVVRTYGALNTLDEELTGKRSAELKAHIADIKGRPLKGPVLGALLGGDTKNIKFDIKLYKRMIQRIIMAAEDIDAQILLTTSRRTHHEIELFLKEKLSADARCRLLVIANEKNIPGAVPGILGLSDLVVISPDSISMISEAASSGRKVVVVDMHDAAKSRALKHNRFLAALSRKKYITLAGVENLTETIKLKLADKQPAVKLDDNQAVYEALKKIV